MLKISSLHGFVLAGMLLLSSQAGLADGARTDLTGPGEAEVIAGIGYEHTLFDSADNKCQHCHDTVIQWTSPDGTVTDSEPVQNADGSWSVTGVTTVKKIIDTDATDQFTRIYGRETGKRKDGTHVVRPGFDSNIAADNRLEPNEQEIYRISYDTAAVTAWPVTVTYKVYYLKKGGNGKFPTGDDGFLAEGTPAKAAIFEAYSETVVID